MRGLHHRCITPVFSDCRTDYPFHRTFLCPCRELRTEHKPTVVMIYPSIIQQQVSFLTFNRNLCQIILRIEYKLFPAAKGAETISSVNHRVISLSIQQQLVQISFPVRVEISDMLHIGRLFHGGPHRLVGERLPVRLSIIHGLPSKVEGTNSRLKPNLPANRSGTGWSKSTVNTR